ncbi:MarR family transcriptional regulator [Xanthobacter tagetidis]|uniref:MarR family transcriptional regulator n=2 Tax=Xanthobacter tagetidis TaxID=60216 RepID=A0A3L7AQA7_9HYPH|nr:MarR family transcriptional regulator [Xanthobacter tagetidis]
MPQPSGAMLAPSIDVADSWPDWLAAGAGPEAQAALKASPGFGAALLASARGTVETYDNHPLLNRVLNDRGRMMFSFLAFYLDAQPGGAGITAARMTALCQETGLCSHGRAKALLALMRWSGYLAPAEGKGDRRERPLAPTERMWASFRTRWRLHFAAMEPLGGVAARVLAVLDDPLFCRALVTAIGESFRHGFRVLDGAPRLIPFADRDGGIILLFALLVSREVDAPPPTVADLARRFHLSRTHVLQVLRDAMEAGLVVRASGRDGEHQGYGLSAAGRAGVADFLAASFALLDCTARHAFAMRAQEDAAAGAGSGAQH